MNERRLKIVTALIISFLSVNFFSEKIFLANSPLIRADFKDNILNLPREAGQKAQGLITYLNEKKPKPNLQNGRNVPRSGMVTLPPGRNYPTGFYPTSAPFPTFFNVPTSTVPTTTRTPTVPRAPTATPTSGSLTVAQFAQCLTSKGMKVYGTSYCGACQQQKALFGSAYSYINDIDCQRSPQVCSSKGISTYPTWEDGSGGKHQGARPFSSLSQMSGCQTPTN